MPLEGVAIAQVPEVSGTGPDRFWGIVAKDTIGAHKRGLSRVKCLMRRLPGKYVVFAMLMAFLVIAVFIVLVVLGTWAVLAGHPPLAPVRTPDAKSAPAR